jgi:hypothetical protein
MDLTRAPRRAPLTARKKGSGYENALATSYEFGSLVPRLQLRRAGSDASSGPGDEAVSSVSRTEYKQYEQYLHDDGDAALRDTSWTRYMHKYV